MNNPIAQVYKHVTFRNKIGIPTILGQGTPSFRKRFIITSTSIVERYCTYLCLHSTISILPWCLEPTQQSIDLTLSRTILR